MAVLNTVINKSNSYKSEHAVPEPVWLLLGTEPQLGGAHFSQWMPSVSLTGAGHSVSRTKVGRPLC